MVQTIKAVVDERVPHRLIGI